MKWNHRRKNNNGFTLAEMLMTIAILAVLFSLVSVNVIRYQRNLKQLEMDNIAREIFVAAQNHLTAKKASGEWDKFYREAAADGSLGEESLGHRISSGSGAAALPGMPQNQTSSHDFRVIFVRNGKLTGQDGGSEGTGQDAVSRFLPEGSVDGTVLGHTYVIEYDALIGAIYSVFYTDDREAGFSGGRNIYTDSRRDTVDASGKIDVGSGKEQRRRDPVSGYYGGAAGFLQKQNGLFMPVVYVRNAESLVLYVYDFNQNYTPGGTQKEGDSALPASTGKLIVTVQGETSKAKKVLKIDAAGASDSDPAKTWERITYPKVSLRDYQYDDDGKVTPVKYAIVLDSIVRKGMHFDTVFNGREGTQIFGDGDGETDKLIPGENLNITVSLADADGHEATASAFTNSLFDSVSQEDTAGGKQTVITVTNPRHWENLSEEVSGFSQTQDEVFGQDTASYQVRVMQDLTFEKTEDDSRKEEDRDSKIQTESFFDQLNNLNGLDTLRAESYPAVDGGEDIRYTTVRVLKSDDKGNTSARTAPGIVNTGITGIEGNDNVMSGFCFRGSAAAAGNAAPVALAGRSIAVQNLKIDHVTAIADPVQGTGGGRYIASGLIAEADAEEISVRNVREYGLVRIGGYGAGGLIGSAKVSKALEIEDCSIDGGENGIMAAIDPGKETLSQAGGLAGDVTLSDGAKASFTGSHSSIYVQATDNAGGMIGSIRGSGQLAVDRCYAGGRTKDGSFLGTAADEAIQYKTLQTLKDDTFAVRQGSYNVRTYGNGEKAGASSAGGLIGAIDGVSADIKNSYTTASVYAAGAEASARAGGFIGSITSSADCIDCYAASLVHKEPSGGELYGIGLFVGSIGQSGRLSGKHNYVLGGVTSVDTVDVSGTKQPAATNIGLKTGTGEAESGKTETGKAGTDKIQKKESVVKVSFGGASEDGDKDGFDPFIPGPSAGGSALPYDEKLKDRDYPYRTTEQLAALSGSSEKGGSGSGSDPAKDKSHVGDWPSVKALKFDIDNGTALSLYTESGILKAGQFYAVSVTGETSNKTGAVIFMWNDAAGKTLASPLTVEAYHVSSQKNAGRLALWNGDVEFDEETQEAKKGRYDHISIDAITAADAHFADLFSGDGLYPGENISVSLFALPCRKDGTAADLTGEEDSKNGSYQVRTSSLFELGSKDEKETSYQVTGGYDVLIGNVRHLENLSVDVSGFTTYYDEKEKHDAVISWNENNKAQLTCPVDASLDGLTVYYCTESTGADEKHTEKPGQFASIQNSTLAEFTGARYAGEGEKKTIAEYYPVSNLHAVASCGRDGTGRTEAGLFGSIRLEQKTSLTVKGVKLDGKVVSKARDYAGSLIGDVLTYGGGLTVSDCLVIPEKGLQVSDNLVETSGTGDGAAGGLIGSVTTSQYPDISISDSAVSLYVKSAGKGGAGGLIGQIVRLDPADTGKSASVDIRNCYAGGRTSGGLYDMAMPNVQSISDYADSAAGGFIGINTSGSGRIESCYSTASVSSKEGYAAGIIGYCESTEITAANVYATAFVSRTGHGGNGDQSIRETDGVDTGDVKATLFLNGRNLKTGSRDNYVLSGVKSTDAGAENVTWIGTRNVVSSASEGPFAQEKSAGTYAYDNTLGEYPYRTVAVLDGHSHIGDWVTGEEKRQEETENYLLSVHNGNILKADFQTDGTEDYAFFYVAGESSGSVAQFAIGKNGDVIRRLLNASAGETDVDNWVSVSDSWDAKPEDISGLFTDGSRWQYDYLTDIPVSVTGQADGRTYSVSLDDVTGEETKFRNLFKGFFPGENLLMFAASKNLSRQDLYQIHMDCTADSIGSIVPGAAVEEDNSLYGYQADDKNTYLLNGHYEDRGSHSVMAHVANIRHLANLDYENLSVTYKNRQGDTSWPAVTAVQTADISWDDFVKETGKDTVSNTDNLQWGQLASQGFAGIRNPKLSSYRAGKNGERYVQIRNLPSAMGNASGGLFREVTGTDFYAEGITLVGPVLTTRENYYAGAIIGRIYEIGEVTLTDCTVEDPQISAKNAAGGAVGLIDSSTGEFSAVRVSVKDPVVTAVGDAGGYTGRDFAVISDYRSCRIENPEVNADQNSYGGNAGGLIGLRDASSGKVSDGEQNGETETSPRLVIEDTSVVLKKYDETDPAAPIVDNQDTASVEAYSNAGGVIGKLTGQGTCTILGVDVSAGLTSCTRDSGGMITDNSYEDRVRDAENHGRLAALRTGDLVTADGTNSAKNAGGLIGSAAGDGKALSLNILASFVDGGTDGVIKGNGNAGGLAGYVGDVTFHILDSHASVLVRSELPEGAAVPGGLPRCAGGLLGRVKLSGDHTGFIGRCYVSGRTEDLLSPASEDTCQDSNITAAVYGPNNSGSPVCAGGLIGYAKKEGAGDIRIESSYSTASVYGKREYPSNAELITVGGFIGQNGGKEMVVYNCYTAAKVWADDDSGEYSDALHIGYFMGGGRLAADDASDFNYWVPGISSDEIASLKKSNQNDDADDASRNVSEDKGNKTYAAEEERGSAHPYAESRYDDREDIRYPYNTTWLLQRRIDKKRDSRDALIESYGAFLKDLVPAGMTEEGYAADRVDRYVIPEDKIHAGDWLDSTSSRIRVKSASADAFFSLARVREALAEDPAVTDVQESTEADTGALVTAETSADTAESGDAVPVTLAATADGTTVTLPALSEDGRTLETTEETLALTTDINEMAFGTESAEDSTIITDEGEDADAMAVINGAGDGIISEVPDGITDHAEDAAGEADQAAIISGEADAGAGAEDPSREVSSVDLSVQTASVLDLSGLSPARDGYRLAGWKVTEYLPANDTEMSAALSLYDPYEVTDDAVAAGEGTDAQPADPSMDEAEIQALAEENAAMLPAVQKQVICQAEVPADDGTQSVQVTGGDATGAAAVVLPEAEGSGALVQDGISVDETGSADPAVIADNGGEDVVTDGTGTDSASGETGAYADLSGSFTPMTVTASVDDGLRYRKVEYHFEPDAKIQVTGDMTVEAVWTLADDMVAEAQQNAARRAEELTRAAIGNWKTKNSAAIQAAVKAGIAQAEAQVSREPDTTGAGSLATGTEAPFIDGGTSEAAAETEGISGITQAEPESAEAGVIMEDFNPDGTDSRQETLVGVGEDGAGIAEDGTERETGALVLEGVG